MSRNLLIFGFILILIVIFAYYGFAGIRTGIGGKSVDIHGNVVKVKIADSPEEQTKGLSQVDSLPQDQGMLFLFEKSDTYSFWMKDVRFPLDIIFLDDDKVVTIHKNVQPQIGEENAANYILYSPRTPANRVLELNAGQADTYKLKEGDTVTYNL